jgi:hypothetical protein
VRALCNLLSGRPQWLLSTEWSQANHWLIYTLVGIIVPPALSAYLIVALKGEVTLAGFTSHGQFAIYSLSLWITTHRLILRGLGNRLPGEPWLGPVLLLGIIVSMAFFVMGLLASNKIDIDTLYIEWPSVVFFIITVAVTYFVVALDASRSNFDPREMNRKSLENLQDDFRRSGTQSP